MYTRQDVAKLAHVSVATVSNVLSGKKYVSSPLQKRVHDAIEELGYLPNQAARCLATKQSRHLAIIVNDICNPRYAEVTEAMQKEAASHGYIVSIVDITRFGIGSGQVFDLIARNVDGIFVATYIDEMRADIERAMQSGICVVSGTSDLGAVLKIDYQAAIDEMIADLAGLGHRSIGFISCYSIHETQHDKYKCYCSALQSCGLPINPSLVVDGCPPYHADLETGYAATRELLARGIELTAVFAVNDLAAIGACRAIREAGLRIPQDISVVGCDDIAFSQYTEPKLSTIHVPKAEMGRRAVRMLNCQLNGGACENVCMPSGYVRRQTVASANAG